MWINLKEKNGVFLMLFKLNLDFENMWAEEISDLSLFCFFGIWYVKLKH